MCRYPESSGGWVSDHMCQCQGKDGWEPVCLKTPVRKGWTKKFTYIHTYLQVGPTRISSPSTDLHPVQRRKYVAKNASSRVGVGMTIRRFDSAVAIYDTSYHHGGRPYSTLPLLSTPLCMRWSKARGKEKDHVLGMLDLPRCHHAIMHPSNQSSNVIFCFAVHNIDPRVLVLSSPLPQPPTPTPLVQFLQAPSSFSIIVLLLLRGVAVFCFLFFSYFLIFLFSYFLIFLFSYFLIFFFLFSFFFSFFFNF